MKKGKILMLVVASVLSVIMLWLCAPAAFADDGPLIAVAPEAPVGTDVIGSALVVVALPVEEAEVAFVPWDVTPDEVGYRW